MAVSQIDSTGLAAGGVAQTNVATGVAGTGPAFAAAMSASQTIAINTPVKVQFNTKIFDTATAYDATTNYRFTPQVAGYYQINLAMRMNDSGAGGVNEFSYIYKNGSVYSTVAARDTTGQSVNLSQSVVVYLNGSTDYIEIYAQQNSGTSGNISGGANQAMFSASLVRAQ